jgi:UDP-N-acetylmuramoyl-tripeptide--D-alanyl-D-alanine ligase
MLWDRDAIVTAVGGRLLWSAGPRVVGGVSTDSRTIRPGEVFFALVGDRFDGNDFAADVLSRGAAGVIVSRPLPQAPAGFAVLVDDTTAALGRLAADHRSRLSATVVGVTGSNGKTTTKEMIAHMLAGSLPGTWSARSFNNFIGVPVTLLGIRPEHAFAVVEIGTNAPGEVARLAGLARPDIAVVTSAAPSHLEGLGSLDGVIEEEADGVAFLSADGAAIVNADVPGLPEAAARRLRPGTELILFGRHPRADWRLTQLRPAWDSCEAEVNGRLRFRLPVPGPHNAINALAAIAVGRRMRLSEDEILARLATVRLPDQRLQARQVGSVTLINDAYNANPGSMAAALEVLKLAPAARRRVFCAGDMLELGPAAPGFHRELGQRAAAAADLLVAVGPMAEVTAEGALRGGLSAERVRIFPDSRRAAETVPDWLRPADFVLVKGSRGIRMEAVAEAISGMMKSE